MQIWSKAVEASKQQHITSTKKEDNLMKPTEPIIQIKAASFYILETEAQW